MVQPRRDTRKEYAFDEATNLLADAIQQAREAKRAKLEKNEWPQPNFRRVGTPLELVKAMDAKPKHTNTKRRSRDATNHRLPLATQSSSSRSR
jgi:hypothetical protein